MKVYSLLCLQYKAFLQGCRLETWGPQPTVEYPTFPEGPWGGERQKGHPGQTLSSTAGSRTRGRRPARAAQVHPTPGLQGYCLSGGQQRSRLGWEALRGLLLRCLQAEFKFITPACCQQSSSGKAMDARHSAFTPAHSTRPKGHTECDADTWSTRQ